MNQEQMYFKALGAVTDLIVASNFYNEIIPEAESPIEGKRYARNALLFKAKAIVKFDREMDQLVKQTA